MDMKDNRRIPMRRHWLGAIGGRSLATVLPWLAFSGRTAHADPAEAAASRMAAGAGAPRAAARSGRPVPAGQRRHLDGWILDEGDLPDRSGR